MGSDVNIEITEFGPGFSSVNKTEDRSVDVVLFPRHSFLPHDLLDVCDDACDVVGPGGMSTAAAGDGVSVRKA